MGVVVELGERRAWTLVLRLGLFRKRGTGSIRGQRGVGGGVAGSVAPGPPGVTGPAEGLVFQQAKDRTLPVS